MVEERTLSNQEIINMNHKITELNDMEHENILRLIKEETEGNVKCSETSRGTFIQCKDLTMPILVKMYDMVALCMKIRGEKKKLSEEYNRQETLMNT
jgi:hypothetical protein